MRIAQIAPFVDPVSFDSENPEGKVIAHLASGLIRLGHDVTVFASGDSTLPGDLVPVAPRAMRAYPAPKRHLADALTFLALEKAFATKPSFDLIHVHAGLVAFPLMRRSPSAVLATVYGELGAPELRHVYRQFKELALVATREDQIQECADLNWQSFIPIEFVREHHDHRALQVHLARAYEAVYEWSVLTQASSAGLFHQELPEEEGISLRSYSRLA